MSWLTLVVACGSLRQVFGKKFTDWTLYWSANSSVLLWHRDAVYNIIIICVLGSRSRRPIVRNRNNMCHRMCVDVVAAALLLYTTRLVHTHTHTHAIASVVYTGVVCPFRCTGGICSDCGGSGEGQIVYLLTSLTCWCSLVNVLRVKHLLFFIRPSLLCSPRSAAIILARRRFVVVVVVYSPPSLKHRHRMRISLHRCSERAKPRRQGEKTGGDEPHIIRGRRAHYKACSFNIIVSSGPCETAPAAKESRELSVPPYPRRRKFHR